MPRANTRITRDSLNWYAEDVAGFLENSCIGQPNPQFEDMLRVIWDVVLHPFFAGSPAGDSSHGEFLENYVPPPTIMAPLNPSGTLAIQVRDVCGAIAYVLSTSTEHIPFKKYLILAGAFTQFCRLVNSNQRPKRVHIFWPTGIDPIILIDDASLFFRDPQYNSRDGYREFTLEYLFSSPGLAGNTMPDCDCSQLIPAILSLNEGQTLQFFSADFAKLLSLLKYYRKEGGGFAPFKSAARPACDTCRTLMWGIGLHYEDLGVDEFKLDESSSYSDGSVQRRPFVSAENGSPTGRPRYPAAGRTPSDYDSVRFSPPETRASIEQVPPRRKYSHTTVPGVHHPICPPGQTETRAYAPPPFQTQPPPPPRAQQPGYHRFTTAPAIYPSYFYARHPVQQAMYPNGGFVPGYYPAPSASPVYSVPSHQGVPLGRPTQSRARFNNDKEGINLLIPTY